MTTTIRTFPEDSAIAIKLEVITAMNFLSEISVSFEAHDRFGRLNSRSIIRVST